MIPPRSIIIHGHFYQPPREDPWLGEVEGEPSAAPFHDWNERIDHECYRPVTAARIVGPDGRIARIVNTLAGISYNAGSTLLAWMQRQSPKTYAAFLAADGESRRHRPFGNAMAMPYHHVILPLCSRRDKVTEVRWGMQDFERRFGRPAQGMWLPETAVDDETLDVLAAEGVQFTVVGPTQVKRIPAAGLPGRCRTSGGRSIAVFVYDGPLSHDVAFGPLVRDSGQWVSRILTDEDEPRRLVCTAIDGETWGHHHKFGEMALAAVLEQLAQTSDVSLDNFASFLARNPPVEDVSVISPSSWSCPHGVERWRSDCGCKIAPLIASQQRWRVPLRVGLDWLAGELHDLFALEGKEFFGDVWAARDRSGPVAEEPPEVGPIETRARELLELERNALAMFTSCGWFFDDVADIATLVVLRHAARAIELAGGQSGRLEAGLLRYLAEARSNDPAIGDGARLYQGRIAGRPAPTRRAAGGFAAARSLNRAAETDLPGYRISGDGSSVVVSDRRTGRKEVFRVEVGRPSSASIRIAADERSLDFADLPEQHQKIVRAALVGATLEKWFSAADLQSLNTGNVDPRGLAEYGLVSAVRDLNDNSIEGSVARMTDLIDLLELLGVYGVPFDAQTEFYRVWSCARGDARARLDPTASRLGFTTS